MRTSPGLSHLRFKRQDRRDLRCASPPFTRSRMRLFSCLLGVRVNSSSGHGTPLQGHLITLVRPGVDAAPETTWLRAVPRVSENAQNQLRSTG